jgi:hypothetical protein
MARTPAESIISLKSLQEGLQLPKCLALDFSGDD